MGKRCFVMKLKPRVVESLNVVQISLVVKEDIRTDSHEGPVIRFCVYAIRQSTVWGGMGWTATLVAVARNSSTLPVRF